MKIGVPVFGYQHFAHFEAEIRTKGFFTANLGDNMQSIAIRLLLNRLGVDEKDTLSINRDTLSSYSGPAAALLMNGFFPSWCFPTPPQILPIFIGLHVDEHTVRTFIDYFSLHQPIGCRDTHTKEIFERNGISAFVSGCLTMTIPRRRPDVDANRVLVVYGAGAGALPSALLKRMPPHYLDSAEFVFQRIPVNRFPVDETGRYGIEMYARGLLDHYAACAKVVVTPLHHAATPCMALGIPVIICREAMDPRFSLLSALTRVYTPESFDEVDWNPAPLSLDSIRQHLESLVWSRISNL